MKVSNRKEGLAASFMVWPASFKGQNQNFTKERHLQCNFLNSVLFMVCLVEISLIFYFEYSSKLLACIVLKHKVGLDRIYFVVLTILVASKVFVYFPFVLILSFCKLLNFVSTTNFFYTSFFGFYKIKIQILLLI